jgi:Pyruvate/2-oxoacid:ferredoxin oxidoreductase gamma subunit
MRIERKRCILDARKGEETYYVWIHKKYEFEKRGKGPSYYYVRKRIYYHKKHEKYTESRGKVIVWMRVKERKRSQLLLCVEKT